MVDTAAWLCDAVLPEVPVRQWVLSLPYRVRALCAYDAAACALVRSVLVRAVSGFYERTAGRAGVPRPRTGAVAFVQRFDSALRLNVHFHVLWLDGVYGWVPGQEQPVFHTQPEGTDADVQLLVQRIRARVLRALRKAGKWVDEDAAADADCAPADDLLPGLAAAAVARRAAFGARAGRRDGRVGGDGRWRPQAKGPLCAELDGFSLHANTWVAPRDRERLEALCRYAARPAVSESRLAELPDVRIGNARKRRFADGTAAVGMTNAVLMEHRCALVPPPRKHLVTYHGVLAPASGLRPKVVPRQTAAGEEEAAGAAAGCRHGAGGGGVGQVAGRIMRRRRRCQRLRSYVASTRNAAPVRVCGCHTAVAVAAVAGSVCRGRTCCGACLASTCWSARSARARGACWRRSTIRRRLRGCSRRSG